MQLRRWDTSEVIFELECSSWEELLKGALRAKISFYRADFSGSDFSRSDFSGSNFIGSDFSGSDFRGSKHQYKIGNMKEWHSMQLDTYMICFNKHILAIGCQQHAIKKWQNFTDDEISKMDGGALPWWSTWKDFIFKAIELSTNKKP